MNTKIFFTERQKFNQWWLWAVLLGINVLFMLGTYRQVVDGHQFGDKPMSNEGLLLTTGLVLLLTILFVIFRLETQIKSDGIYVRFFPFHFSYQHFTWDKISKSFIREYRPLTEYGGWGLRLNLFGMGKAYNVSGNKGLQLEFSNKKRLLIGTNKPAEMTKALEQVGQLRR